MKLQYVPWCCVPNYPVFKMQVRFSLMLCDKLQWARRTPVRERAVTSLNTKKAFLTTGCSYL